LFNILRRTIFIIRAFHSFSSRMW